MYLVITDNHTNTPIICRQLAPRESTLPLVHARKYAREYDADLAPSTGYIPAGCGDFRVEIRRRKHDTVVCWDGADFFWKGY